MCATAFWDAEVQLDKPFEDRVLEIEAYLAFLDGVENEARSGPPRLGTAGALITTQHQRILYSAVFLHLYNLVESTIVRCLDGVTQAAITSGQWMPGDLNAEVRAEWVRVLARTHTDLNYKHRLDSALVLCRHLVSAFPVGGFTIEKGGGGNWTDEEIEEVVKRLGFTLSVERSVYSGVKRHVRDELGPMALIKKLRNDLAHGDISFAECGENVTVSELRDLADRTIAYLREVVRAFLRYIQDYGFLIEAKRPART